jgi:hypothetical protein
VSTAWISTVRIQQLIKRLEEVRAGPGEAHALVDRMKHGTFSESDWQRLMEILEAEEVALEFLASWNPPTLPSQGQRRAKRKKQMVTPSRRGNRRAMSRGAT